MSAEETIPVEKNKDIKQADKNKILSTQRYLQFSSVHDDTLVLKNGGIRAIIEVTAVNFDLKSEREQDALIISYQHFLNSLDFPVQIIVHSRKLDIDHYLETLEERLKAQSNELLREQVQDHIEYIHSLVEYTDIMEKHFFVIVPLPRPMTEDKSIFAKFWDYISPDDTVQEAIARRKEFNELKKNLDTRINVVTTGLENCGLHVHQLRTEEIIELFYQHYNPDASRFQKLGNINAVYTDDNPEEHLITENKE